jgi:hypothetical protein
MEEQKRLEKEKKKAEMAAIQVRIFGLVNAYSIMVYASFLEGGQGSSKANSSLGIVQS